MLNDRFSKPALIGRVNDLHRVDLSLLYLPNLEGSERLLDLHGCGHSVHKPWEENHEYLIAVLHVISPNSFQKEFQKLRVLSLEI